MSPCLASCYFAGGAEAAFRRLARVLVHTARRHCPTWTVRVECLGPAPARPGGRAGDDANTHKLDHWAAWVAAAPDGARLLLVDTDLMILRPLDAMWDLAFDVAYTVKPPYARLPINAGVIGVRVSPATRAFFATWADENRRLHRDERLHRQWRTKYGGMNQAALGMLLEERQAALGVELRPLPCVEWNCEDTTWRSFHADVTRIVHVKSGLRRVLFHSSPGTPDVRPLALIWRRFEREATEAATPA